MTQQPRAAVTAQFMIKRPRSAAKKPHLPIYVISTALAVMATAAIPKAAKHVTILLTHARFAATTRS
jgi:hypothetical protein